MKWTRRTTDKIACELRSLGVNVSSKTVGRLLKQLGFSLRVNHKKLCGATSEDRDTQFACIAELRERFAAAGHPIISVDTKKRELVGLFKNGGQAWNREPTLVKDHDFRSESNGIAIPSCAKTRPSRHRRKNCASRNQAKTLAREQVTRRPPTLDCGSTIWTRRERKRSRFYLNIGVARVTAFRVPHTATTADR